MRVLLHVFYLVLFYCCIAGQCVEVVTAQNVQGYLLDSLFKCEMF